jgi:hypothetical protein
MIANITQNTFDISSCNSKTNTTTRGYSHKYNNTIISNCIKHNEKSITITYKCENCIEKELCELIRHNKHSFILKQMSKEICCCIPYFISNDMWFVEQITNERQFIYVKMIYLNSTHCDLTKSNLINYDDLFTNSEQIIFNNDSIIIRHLWKIPLIINYISQVFVEKIFVKDNKIIFEFSINKHIHSAQHATNYNIYFPIPINVDVNKFKNYIDNNKNCIEYNKNGFDIEIYLQKNQHYCKLNMTDIFHSIVSTKFNEEQNIFSCKYSESKTSIFNLNKIDFIVNKYDYDKRIVTMHYRYSEKIGYLILKIPSVCVFKYIKRILISNNSLEIFFTNSHENITTYNNININKIYNDKLYHQKYNCICLKIISIFFDKYFIHNKLKRKSFPLTDSNSAFVNMIVEKKNKINVNNNNNNINNNINNLIEILEQNEKNIEQNEKNIEQIYKPQTIETIKSSEHYDESLKKLDKSLSNNQHINSIIPKTIENSNFKTLIEIKKTLFLSIKINKDNLINIKNHVNFNIINNTNHVKINFTTIFYFEDNTSETVNNNVCIQTKENFETDAHHNKNNNEYEIKVIYSNNE